MPSPTGPWRRRETDPDQQKGKRNANSADDYHGELGNGDIPTDSDVPVAITNLTNVKNIKNIDGGEAFALAAIQ
jgi:hypothetical protein